MPREKKPDYCPKCFLQDSVDEPLQYKLGSTAPLRCSRGHEYLDREELSVLMREMGSRRASGSARLIIPPTPEEIQEKKEEKKSAISESQEFMKISPIDFARISQILGHFTDSSSLFGAIFALNQELQDIREVLAKMQDSQVRKTGGDMEVRLIIPERWVVPLTEIAEANGTTLTQYVNDKFEWGCDNQWFV